MSEEESRVAVKSQAINRAQRRNLMLLWTSLFGLVVADGLITEYIVGGGLGQEWNSFLAIMIDNGDFLVFKAFGVVLAILILRNVAKRNYMASLAASCCSVLLYSVIVFWNLVAFHLGLS